VVGIIAAPIEGWDIFFGVEGLLWHILATTFHVGEELLGYIHYSVFDLRTRFEGTIIVWVATNIASTGALFNILGAKNRRWWARFEGTIIVRVATNITSIVTLFNILGTNRWNRGREIW